VKPKAAIGIAAGKNVKTVSGFMALVKKIDSQRYKIK
jgi:preprotein translocase subunit YajC